MTRSVSGEEGGCCSKDRMFVGMGGKSEVVVVDVVVVNMGLDDCVAILSGGLIRILFVVEGTKLQLAG